LQAFGAEYVKASAAEYFWDKVEADDDTVPYLRDKLVDSGSEVHRR
jgi:hypothetical protein